MSLPAVLYSRQPAAAAFPDASKRIHILAPRRTAGAPPPFEDLRAQYPRLLIEHPIPAESWAPAKVFQVSFADAVVVMAGAKGSQQAGLTAAASGTRLVCIGFGLAHVLILTRGAVEVPSDLGGVERYEYTGTPSDCASEIDAFLATLGQGRG